MLGRQVIKTNRSFTLSELEQFMRARWNTEDNNHFLIGRPTPVSVEEYILLPATQHFMVIVCPRRAGGLFHKEHRVILSVCENTMGAQSGLLRVLPVRGVMGEAWKNSTKMSMKAERKGPAEVCLYMYTAHLKKLFLDADFLLPSEVYRLSEKAALRR